MRSILISGRVNTADRTLQIEYVRKISSLSIIKKKSDMFRKQSETVTDKHQIFQLNHLEETNSQKTAPYREHEHGM